MSGFGVAAVLYEVNDQFTGLIGETEYFAPEQVLNTPPVEVIGSESDQAVTMLTDVQKIAIEQTMSINNFTFEELAAKALGRTDNLPKSIDELTYSDAVKLIQHGNDLRPVI